MTTDPHRLRRRRGGAGHPRVWLQIDPDKGWVECGYCDRQYVLKAGAEADH